MHNEFLDLAGEKVSKSKGHVLVVDSLLERGLDPLAFRYFFLQAHYRQQQSFTWDAMAASATAHRRLVRHAIAARDAGGIPHGPSVEPHLKRFWSALADDLNSPQALAVVWDVVRAVDLGPAERWAFLADADRALGLALGTAEDADADEGGSDHRIDTLVADRHAARVAADFISADRIRNRLATEGIQLIDTPNGTIWRRR